MAKFPWHHGQIKFKLNGTREDNKVVMDEIDIMHLDEKIWFDC